MSERLILRPILVAALLGLGLAPGACRAADDSSAGSRRIPNMVFFLVDDLGWKDLGCYGSTFHETPHVDRLAREGMRFTQAYAACPVCSPTRASIMTGKYPDRVGISAHIDPQGYNQPENWKRNSPLLPPHYNDRLGLEETTLAEALRAAGYSTYFAGKWHLGPQGSWPEDQGFDINKGGVELGGPYRGKKYFSPYGNPRLEDGPPGEYLTDRLASETVRFIEAHKDKPFLAFHSFYSVHEPLMAPQDRVAKYQDKAKQMTFSGPRFKRERNQQVNQVQDHAVYAAMVASMDMAVGRVLEALDDAGLAEKTIVVFMSDNGGLSTAQGMPTSNVPLRGGKGWLYEGGIREPMIIRWPGVVRPGSVCPVPVISMDFYPTLLEMAGLPLRPEQHRDGRSLVPLLKGAPELDREALYWSYPHYNIQGGQPGAAIRCGQWKLIEWYEEKRIELYQLSEDIEEAHDLAAAHQDKAQELHGKLDAWRKALKVAMPVPNPKYQPEKDDGSRY